MVDIKETSIEVMSKWILGTKIFETSYEEMVKETIYVAMSKVILGVKCIMGVSFEKTIEVKGKYMFFKKKGLEESIEEMIFGAVDKILEKDMDMLFEVKGCAKSKELINEVLGKNMFNEVRGQDEFWPSWERPSRSSVCW